MKKAEFSVGIDIGKRNEIEIDKLWMGVWSMVGFSRDSSRILDKGRELRGFVLIQWYPSAAGVEFKVSFQCLWQKTEQ